MFSLPSLAVRREDDETIVRFADLDRLDEYNSEAAGQQLCRLADGLPHCRLVLDLANINYVTSSGLGQLLTLNHKVRAVGGRLRLANLSPAVAEVITVMCLDRVLEVCGGHAA